MTRKRAVSEVRFRGEVIPAERIDDVRRVVRDKTATRRELTMRLCQLWQWRQPNGELSLRSCRDLLLRLQKRSLIELPAPLTRPGRRKRVEPAEAIDTPEPIEQVDLRRVVVRPLQRQEVAHWRQLMAMHHYLGDGELVGESLRYVAEYQGEWLALLGWGAAAWKSRHRERFVGWSTANKQKRLHFVVNNSRFLILPWVRVRHLASCVLAANSRRLSADWFERYEHRVFLAETFVDLERFRGVCYRAANWKYLGQTRGMRREGQAYRAHGKPKGLFVLALHERACEILASPLPSPETLEVKSMATAQVNVDVNRLPLLGKGGLIDVLKRLTDPRHRRGIRHPFESVLALSVMATLSGMRSFEAIAEWAKDVPKEILKQLRCWCHQAPSEPTFRRVLQRVDADAVDQEVGKWLARQEGLEGKGVALDGKTLRGSGDGDNKPAHLLSVVVHGRGTVVAQESVGEKTNEIPHAKTVLEKVELAGTTVTANAMHTQAKLARFLVEEKEADYVFIAKDNQPTLHQDIKALHEDDFSPSGENDESRSRSHRAPGHRATE